MAVSDEQLFESALGLAKNIDDTFLDLGKQLAMLHDRDRRLFSKLVTKSGLGSRKAYYLVEIHRAFYGLGVSRTRLKKIGWTKLQVIAKKVTKHNVDELLDLCESHTARQLAVLLRGEKPITNAHCVLMYFTPKQYAELEDALKEHGAKKAGRGLLDKEDALIRLIRTRRQRGDHDSKDD